MERPRSPRRTGRRGSVLLVGALLLQEGGQRPATTDVARFHASLTVSTTVAAERPGCRAVRLRWTPLASADGHRVEVREPRGGWRPLGGTDGGCGPPAWSGGDAVTERRRVGTGPPVRVAYRVVAVRGRAGDPIAITAPVVLSLPPSRTPGTSP